MIEKGNLLLKVNSGEAMVDNVVDIKR